MKSVSISDLQTDPSAVIKNLKKQKTTALTDTHGQRRAYLVDSSAYEQLHSRLILLEGIARGERAIQEGRVSTHAQAKKKLSRWLEKSL